MQLDLAGRSYVVGGASRGLGRAIATELVRHGARVLLVARSADALADVGRELGDAAVPCAADLADPGAAEAIAAAARDAFGGGLHGVVVNGGGPPPGRALDHDDEVWRAAYELLVGGPLRLLRALEPSLADASAILFVTSSSVRQPIPGLDTSNVLRPAVAALAKVLALELGPRVRVNSLAPGRFDTDRIRQLHASAAEQSGQDLDAVRAASAQEIPAGRLGDPEEFARVAAFLLSGDASYVSGVALMVDGGLVTAQP
jgi:3-oxoacyl-[acyl-carrier protein] reductase